MAAPNIGEIRSPKAVKQTNHFISTERITLGALLGRSAMGERNSTRLRVEPVFDELLSCDASGRAWLPTLLALPTGRVQRTDWSGVGPLRCWG